ncbi:hypothetical protein ESZ53_07370 [Salinibacterium sp. UTAS2018]|uniref:hypothetical protein n=1 Tax=Salinibacterium sp. UTAS2018 TaxID=2508880 RepID=UPI0010096F48|nr:hypothetical protein [Salinibacterium sp. UTAS2018]QAV70276.1 hypothetical protein ESZ53_07370 [Salinibacterium sp. UTAS2018]
MQLALRRTVGITAAAALSLFLGVAPASAATGGGDIELSADGVSFASTYPGAVFDSVALLSPGDSQTETIYVRNTGTAAGYLRVTMRDVSFSDTTYADALTVTTSAPSSAGSSHSLSAAAPCLVTHEGTVIAAGQTVPVTATLDLGELTGLQGQGATASVSLRFTLSDTTPGSLPATQCANSGSTAVLVPASPSSPNTPSSLDGTAVAGSVTALTLPTPSPSPSPALAGPEVDSANGLTPTFPSGFTLDPNSWRLYQEYLVLILFLAALVGAGISWIVGLRTRKDADDV